MRIEDHAIDVKKREEGEWVNKIPEFPGLRLKTRGVGNRDWRKLRDQMLQDIPSHQRIDGIPPELTDKINATLLRDAALLDWEGPEDEEGKPLPFSKEQAGEYLFNPELERFRDACMWAATVVADKRRADVDKDVKN